MAQLEGVRNQRAYFEGRKSFYGAKELYQQASWQLDRALVGTTELSHKIRQRLLAQAQLDAQAGECKPPGSDGYIYRNLQPLATLEFGIARLSKGDETTCVGSLASVETLVAPDGKPSTFLEAEVVAVATKVGSLIGHPNQGVAHEVALQWYIASNPTRCDGSLSDPMAVNSKVNGCSSWISEPQSVTETLPNSKLQLTAASKFESINITIGTADLKTGNWITPPTRQTIVDGIAKYAPQAKGGFEVALAQIEKVRGLPYAVQLFQRPHHRKRLVVLNGFSQAPVVDSGSAQPSLPLYLTHEDIVVLVMDNNQVQPFWIPPRFRYQYDNGSISAVSDLDEDGNLEVWFEGTWGECDGDGEDLKPGIDCDISTTYMGEQFGNALSWFVRGSAPIAIGGP